MATIQQLESDIRVLDDSAKEEKARIESETKKLEEVQDEVDKHKLALEIAQAKEAPLQQRINQMSQKVLKLDQERAKKMEERNREAEKERRAA